MDRRRFLESSLKDAHEQLAFQVIVFEIIALGVENVACLWSIVFSAERDHSNRLLSVTVRSDYQMNRLDIKRNVTEAIRVTRTLYFLFCLRLARSNGKDDEPLASSEAEDRFAT